MINTVLQRLEATGDNSGDNRTSSGHVAESHRQDNDENYPILVHSHLGWDWVWQRPQQFLSRLSQRHPILFVEAPLAVEGVTAPRAVLREVTDFPNITVLRTEFPSAFLADREAVDAEQRRLVTATLAG